MADRARLSEYFAYDKLLPSVQRSWDAHPDDCATLKLGLWYGRSVGRGCTDINELEYCTDCDKIPGRERTLWWLEHLAYVNWETADEDGEDVFLCDCCQRARAAAPAASAEKENSDD